MIVFWRLFLAYFLTDAVFFHRTINQVRKENPVKGIVLHALVFFFWSFTLCQGYLTMKWPFLELVDLPGWACILLFGAFHISTDDLFQYSLYFSVCAVSCVVRNGQFLCRAMDCFLCGPGAGYTRFGVGHYIGGTRPLRRRLCFF